MSKLLLRCLLACCLVVLAGCPKSASKGTALDETQYAYSAAITGGIKRVGTVNGGWPLQADIAVTTRKDNGLVKPIHTALQGAIAGGQYAQVLQRWGLDVERVDQSLINPPGLPD